jgi:hypothetical protein
VRLSKDEMPHIDHLPCGSVVSGTLEVIRERQHVLVALLHDWLLTAATMRVGSELP